MKAKRKGDIRFDHKTRHVSIVMKKGRKRFSSIGMSSKATSRGKSNVKMESNYDPAKPDFTSYFDRQVRNHDRKDYGPKIKSFGLVKSDYREAKEIYAKHVRESRIQRKASVKRRKKKKPDHCP